MWVSFCSWWRTLSRPWPAAAVWVCRPVWHRGGKGPRGHGNTACPASRAPPAQPSPRGPWGPRSLQGSAPPQVLCQVSLAQVSDVDKAVAAAKDAFENGLWGKISARDRGRLLYRCEPHPHPRSQGAGMLLGGRTRDCTARDPQGRTLLWHVPLPVKPGEDSGCSCSWPVSQTGAGGCLPGGPWRGQQAGSRRGCWGHAGGRGGRMGQLPSRLRAALDGWSPPAPPTLPPKVRPSHGGASHLPGAHSRPSHPSSQGNTIPSHR